MGRSISFRTSNKMTSIAHNNRDEEDEKKLKDTDKHIRWDDVDKNVILENRDIREVYHEQFNKSVIGYNMKQKRNDRKISTEYGAYYKKIRDEKGKGNAEEQREFIVQFGTKDDEWFDLDTSNEMFTEYLDEFKERHPDMIVYNAVIHNDERTPHMHLNIVPVGRGYKRGVASKPSFTKALETSGVTFDEFQEQERESLARIMKEHTNVDRKLVGTHDYKTPAQYREMMGEAEQKLEEANGVMEQANEMMVQAEGAKKEGDKANERVAGINRVVKNVNEQKRKNDARSSEMDTRECGLNLRDENLTKGEKTLKTSQKAFNEHMEKEKERQKLELKNLFTEREQSLDAREELLEENEGNLADRRDEVTVREHNVSKTEKGFEEREDKLEKGEVALKDSKTAFETFKGDEMEELNEKVKEVQAEHLKLTELMEQAKTWTFNQLKELKEKLKKPVKVEMPELYDDDLADLKDDKQMKL